MKNVQDYISEIYKVVGVTFPLELTVVADKITAVDYKTEWQTGSTKPKKDKKGNVVDYVQDYTDHKLTKDQISKLEAYVKSNI